MSGWTQFSYTEKGLNLHAKLLSGSTLKVTRAVAGTGYVNPEVLTKQTGVTNQVHDLILGAPLYPSTGKCVLPIVLKNDNVKKAFTVHQIGIYAIDPDAGEILFCIAQSEVGTHVASSIDTPAYSSTWTAYFSYGQANEVEVTVDPSYTVSPAMLDEVRAIAESGVSAAKNGGVIVIEDTANAPIAGLNIYGKSIQDGAPTPDAPIDIVSVAEAGNISVRVHGKNLLPISHFEGGVNLGQVEYGQDYVRLYDSVSGDDTYTQGTDITQSAVSLTDEVKARFIPIVAGEVYTWSFKTTGATSGSQYYEFRDANYNSISYHRISTAVNTKEYSKTFTAPEDAAFLSFRFGLHSTTVNRDETFLGIQLELGGVTTDYEPYTGQIATISIPNGLRGIPVSSGGNYTDKNGQQWICDELDLVRGVYVQRISKIEFTGEETGWRSGAFSTDENLTYVFLSDSTPENVQHSICSHAEFSVDTAYWNNGQYMKSGSGMWQTLTDMSLDDWKAYLTAQRTNGTPVTVYYPLAVPTETALLSSEIAACRALYANNPYTTVINDAGAEMFVSCIKSQHETAFKMVVERMLSESDVLTKTNTDMYVPTDAYHPATKDYVDTVALTAGTISSVNGKAGAVILNHEDVGAAAADHTHTLASLGAQAAITGGASTITGSNLTASRALVSDANGKVAASAATSTELGYLSGVTSAIQTQLNNKAASAHNQGANTITAGTFSATGVKAANGTDYTTARVRNIYAGTTDMTAGTSTLANGDIYIVYE